MVTITYEVALEIEIHHQNVSSAQTICVHSRQEFCTRRWVHLGKIESVRRDIFLQR